MAGPNRNYFRDRTIAALSTVPGGALNVVRISGPKAREALGSLIASSDLERVVASPGRVRRVFLCTQDGVAFEDAIVVFYANPKSFTGEDVVELFIHGGAVGAKRVLNNLYLNGTVEAHPGEFSFRAVKNGKMSIHQAEGVRDLVAASSEAEMDLAFERSRGLTEDVGERVLEKLKEILALSEVGMDFSDQDLPEVALSELKGMLQAVLPQLRELAATYERSSKAFQGIRLSLVGAPNAGKSSLFNAFLGFDRALVSEVAGTTRDLVTETLELKAKSGKRALFRFVDTAGIRETLDRVESMGIEKVKSEAQRSHAVLWVRSMHKALNQNPSDKYPTEEQPVVQLLSRLKEQGLPILEVWTHLDEANHLRSRIPPDVAGVSTKTLEGMDQLVERMLAVFADGLDRKRGELWITSLEQSRSLESGIHVLERALAVENEALFAYELKEALLSMQSVFGLVTPDDVLGVVFERFCIGK